MRRNAIVTLAVVIVLLALGSQVAIPAFVSSRVEDRLTAHGGSAHVTVESMPAVSLLRGNGKSIDIRASDLKLDMPRDTALDKLDGFAHVHVDIKNAKAGPFAVKRLRLDRVTKSGTYTVALTAVARPSQLTAYHVQRIGDGGVIDDLIAGFAGNLLPVPDDPRSIVLTAELRSSGGNAHVVAVHGVSGALDYGPVATALLGAVANRL